MNIENKAEENPENRAYILGLGRRVANMESSVQNLADSIQHGALIPAQEQRVMAVEERLDNLEDVQMVANLDLIKMKETLEKSPSGMQPGFSVGANIPDLEKRLNDVESLLKRIEGRPSAPGPQKTSGETRAAGSSRDIQEIKNQISQMKAELSSFKSDTEEVIKALISSVKRLSEVMR